MRVSTQAPPEDCGGEVVETVAVLGTLLERDAGALAIHEGRPVERDVHQHLRRRVTAGGKRSSAEVVPGAKHALPEQDALHRDRGLVGRVELLMDAGAAPVCRPEEAFVGVQCHVVDEQVHGDCRARADFLVFGEVDQGQQRRGVLVVVVMGKPLAVAEAASIAEPGEETHARLFEVFLTRHPVVGEDASREHLAREVLRGSVVDLVVLGPVVHPVGARLVQPVLEADERFFDLGHESGIKGGVRAEQEE